MRVALLGVPALLIALALTACSADPDPDAGGDSGAVGDSPSGSAAEDPSPSETVELPRATEAALPEQGACYRLSYDQALAPTSEAESVACSERHDAVTFAVGRLDTVVDGHLLAVDSARVRDQAAQRCPDELARFLGGTPEDLRLSMLRTVWFTPTVAESDTGAEWYRCDVIAVAADGELEPLGGDLGGTLARPDAAARYGICGTAAPDADSFQRVICSREHSWRAIRAVDLGTGDYPGEDRARQGGQSPCEDAGRDVADDPLDFEWGYEWPTIEQWQSGQTYGRCWAPD